MKKKILISLLALSVCLLGNVATVNAADALRKINSINSAVTKAKGSYSVKFRS